MPRSPWAFANRNRRTPSAKPFDSKTIEDILNWVPVKPGDTLFAEAGTVHAIGGGITLCEIQQNSDVTYRLYDYGRGPGVAPREGTGRFPNWTIRR